MIIQRGVYMKELSQILRKEFKDKETAHIYIKEFLYENIATQLKVLIEQRGWTQKELAERAGMKQSRISLLENPNYDKWSISTLTKLGEIFDVGLYLSYENFSKLIDLIDNFRRESLKRKSREDDLSSTEEPKIESVATSSHLRLINGGSSLHAGTHATSGLYKDVEVGVKEGTGQIFAQPDKKLQETAVLS